MGDAIFYFMLYDMYGYFCSFSFAATDALKEKDRTRKSVPRQRRGFRRLIQLDIAEIQGNINSDFNKVQNIEEEAEIEEGKDESGRVSVNPRTAGI